MKSRRTKDVLNRGKREKSGLGEFEKIFRKTKNLEQALREYWTEFKLPLKPLVPLLAKDQHMGQEESFSLCKQFNGRFHVTALLQKHTPVLSPKHREWLLLFEDQIAKVHLHYLAKQIHTVALRSNGDEYFLVIQVTRFSSRAIQEAKKLSSWYQREHKALSGLAILQTAEPTHWVVPPNKAQTGQLKILFGPEWIRTTFEKKPFFLPWMEYLRPQRSALVPLLNKVSGWLNPKPDQVLLDLYCASGFFGINLASLYTNVICVDLRSSARDCVLENAKRLQLKNVKSYAAKVTDDSITRFLKKLDGEKVQVIIDPPPGPLPPGLVGTLAAKKVCRIIRIYPTPESLNAELKKFKREGYVMRKALPLVQHKEAGKCELVVYYEIDRSGILEKRKQAKEKDVAAPTSGLRFVQK